MKTENRYLAMDKTASSKFWTYRNSPISAIFAISVMTFIEILPNKLPLPNFSEFLNNMNEILQSAD